MNKVILMGRLTRDPEVRYSAGESGTAIARYTLAVDRRFKRDGEATADFISCVSFGRTAEFAEGKNSSQQGAGQQPPQNYGGQQNAPQQSVPQQNAPQQNYGGGSFGMGDDGFMNIPEGLDDELPFN